MNEGFLTFEQYPAAREKVEATFHVERRLPDYVFRRNYRFYLLHEFDNGMGDFLEALRRTRSPLASDTVLLSVLDPDPISYFYKYFGKINAFEFEASITKSEYYALRWLNPGNEPDAIQFNTAIETYVPSSRRWAMWGERSREIAVIGLDDVELAAYLVNENGYWMDAETASNEFVAMPFINQKVPEDFRRALIANYGSRADLERALGRKVKYPWEKNDIASGA
jgi:hypothetical protein